MSRSQPSSTEINHVIYELARQTNRPVEEVLVVYEEQLAILGESANVKTYVDVIARRRTRDILTHH